MYERERERGGGGGERERERERERDGVLMSAIKEAKEFVVKHSVH